MVCPTTLSLGSACIQTCNAGYSDNNEGAGQNYICGINTGIAAADTILTCSGKSLLYYVRIYYCKTE